MAEVTTDQKISGSSTDADPDAKSFANFLESVPPSQTLLVIDAIKHLGNTSGGQPVFEIYAPDISLHCDHDACGGPRFFRRSEKDNRIQGSHTRQVTLHYVCSNCLKTEKEFSLRITPYSDSCEITKFGEYPAFGPPTPTRLLKLLGDQRDLFLRGRRCENQGLGIGAFVYYRRVVENQKNRILDEIIKASKKLSLPADKLAALSAAKDEIQFSKAVTSVKEAIPQALLISGHNPLTLLHAALSDGLHDRTDQHCLELAHDVRVVLGELAERLAQVLKDEAELNTAVGRLLRARE